MRGALVALSGVDYAGKSTQIELLRRRLELEHRKHAVTWFRPGYGPELDAARRAVRRLRPRAIPAPGRSAARDAAFRRKGVGEAWVAMACLDTLLQYALKARARVLAGQTVICDRFVPDAVIDLELRFPGVMLGAGAAVVRRIFALCPTPRAHFLLMLDAETIDLRQQLKQEPFPDSSAERAARLTAYESWARRGDAIALDARVEAAAIHQEIWSTLERKGVVGARR